MILPSYTDIDWLRLAAQTAAEASHDDSTQNGAVLVPKEGFIAAAANHFPAMAVWSKPEKYRYIEHAERAAIYAAAKIGTKTAGSTLYCPWYACPECARAIICAGVVEVVGHISARQATPDRWVEQVLAGERMLTQAGVALRWLAEPLGVTILFNGREMSL
jgi:dCMP deaminase